MKPTQNLVLGRTSHILHIFLITHGLEVATDEQRIDFIVVLRFEVLDVQVDGIEFTVTAAFDGNLLKLTLNRSHRKNGPRTFRARDCNADVAPLKGHRANDGPTRRAFETSRRAPAMRIPLIIETATTNDKQL